ncbi:MAG: hypothetical protein U0V73_03400 [Acidimicrobiia bacterium]
MYHWLRDNVYDWGGWTTGGRLFTALFVTFIGFVVVFILIRRPKSERPATWAQCMAGATGTFAMFFLCYAVIPSEWIIWGNAYWQLGDKQWLIFNHQDKIPVLHVNYPFDVPYSVLEDLIVVGIYLVFFALNLWLWSVWQKRSTVSAEASAEGVPARRSRFGRPLKATGA